MIHEETNQFDAADKAYRRALTITVQQNNPAGEADSLLQLGNLYFRMGRLEDAVIFSKQAADMYLKIKKFTQEGVAHSNLANILIKLKRYDEARQEILLAIECKKSYGHAVEPWKTWSILYALEKAVGNREAAEILFLLEELS
ncbi:MAG: tetratricopeptide repeat protein [Candidatus Aminicenantes bacterium]|jgi:tetratricopeptide (TPR) repeat protein